MIRDGYGNEQVALFTWEAEAFREDPLALLLMVEAHRTERREPNGHWAASVDLADVARRLNRPVSDLQAAAWRIEHGQWNRGGFLAEYSFHYEPAEDDSGSAHTLQDCLAAVTAPGVTVRAPESRA